jgi:hypothetical protein
MHLTTSSLAALLLPFLATTAADKVYRYECTCSGNGSVGYYLEYQYSRASEPNSPYVAIDQCQGPTGSCSQDLTYLSAIKATKNGHTFKYHRNILQQDDYEFDGSGEKKLGNNVITLGGSKK